MVERLHSNTSFVKWIQQYVVLRKDERTQDPLYQNSRTGMAHAGQHGGKRRRSARLDKRIEGLSEERDSTIEGVVCGLSLQSHLE